MSAQRSIVVLTDGKAGHENQSKAFVRALGCEAVLVPVRFKSRMAKAASYIFDRLGIHAGALLDGLDAPDASRTAVAVVGTGSGTFYAVRVLARRMGLPCGVVLYPRGYTMKGFDCILAPVFDRPRPAKNVVTVPVNLVAADAAFYAAGVKAFRERHAPSGRPACAVVVGGPNPHATISADWMRRELDRVFSETPDHEHWVTTSRRTPADVEDVIRGFPFDYRLIYSEDHFNPIPAFVSCADVLYVTADSTGMLSEACTFGDAEVRVLDDLTPGPSKFRRFVDGLLLGGYVNGRRKADLSASFARAGELLRLT